MENHSVIKQIVVLLQPRPLNKPPVVASLNERTGQVGVIGSIGGSERGFVSVDLVVTASLGPCQLLYVHLAAWDCMSLKRKNNALFNLAGKIEYPG